MTTSQLQEKKMLGTITNMEAASRARGTYPMNVYWGGACLDLLRIRISQIAASVESRGMNLMHSLFFLKATSSVKTKQNKNNRSFFFMQDKGINIIYCLSRYLADNYSRNQSQRTYMSENQTVQCHSTTEEIFCELSVHCAGIVTGHCDKPIPPTSLCREDKASRMPQHTALGNRSGRWFSHFHVLLIFASSFQSSVWLTGLDT